MRIHRIGSKFSKFRGNEEFVSQEILFQCSQLKRHASGVYGLGHFLVKSRNKLIDILRRKLTSFGCAEVSLPILQPDFLWRASGRFDKFVNSNQMFNFKGRNGSWCLAPTGEEIVLDFVKDNIVSYKDLPVHLFQINNKYRDEIRARGGLLRSKEFMMKDGYSFHASYEDMLEEYENMKRCYKQIFDTLELETIIVKAVNADMGGNVSEEFMVPSKTGEDKILLNSETNFALNVETLQSSSDGEISSNSIDLNKFQEVVCTELAHIFQLGTFYSEKMDGVFVDKDGVKKPYYMACYGIGVNRVLGAICENFYDEEGLVWPKAIAPYDVAIVYSKKYEENAFEVYNFLLDKNIDVLIFDSDDGFGSKIKNAKMLGISNIAIVGSNYLENSSIELENRKNSNKLFLNKNELLHYLLR